MFNSAREKNQHIIYIASKKSNDMIQKKKHTNLSFPNIGAKPMITPANADFTCILGSITKSYGRLTKHLHLQKIWTKEILNY